MKNLACILTILVTLSLVAGCGGSGATATPLLTNTPRSSETPIPTDTPTATPTNTPTPTPTPTHTHTPRPTHTPTPEPRKVNFIHPVDLSVAPMYNAYDLNRTEGIIESNAGPEYSFHTSCSGVWMAPHTNDNHPGYDYGSGMCGAEVSGTPVNGMGVGYSGEVILKVDDGIWVDYGNLECTDGQDRRIVMKYGHITPLVNLRDRVDSTITVATLNEAHQELEIQVLGMDPNETDSLHGQQLRGYLRNRVYEFAIDPRLVGLEPLLSFGPRE